MRVMGNAKAKAVYEAELPDVFRRPQTDQALEHFIRAKYDAKRFVAPPRFARLHVVRAGGCRYILKNWSPPEVNVKDLPPPVEPNCERRRRPLSPRTISLFLAARSSNIGAKKLLDNPNAPQRYTTPLQAPAAATTTTATAKRTQEANLVDIFDSPSTTNVRSTVNRLVVDWRARRFFSRTQPPPPLHASRVSSICRKARRRRQRRATRRQAAAAAAAARISTICSARLRKRPSTSPPRRRRRRVAGALMRLAPFKAVSKVSILAAAAPLKNVRLRFSLLSQILARQRLLYFSDEQQRHNGAVRADAGQRPRKLVHAAVDGRAAVAARLFASRTDALDRLERVAERPVNDRRCRRPRQLQQPNRLPHDRASRHLKIDDCELRIRRSFRRCDRTIRAPRSDERDGGRSNAAAKERDNGGGARRAARSRVFVLVARWRRAADALD